METILYILALLLPVVGIAGCFLPVIPGPPIAFLGLLVLQFSNKHPFSVHIIVIMAIVTLVVTIADYLAPVLSTKKFGGSKLGAWGCVLGTIIGLFIPWGLLYMPFVGAFVGEIIYNNLQKSDSDISQAFKAACGAFVGFVGATFFKLITCLIIFIAVLFGMWG